MTAPVQPGCGPGAHRGSCGLLIDDTLITAIVGLGCQAEAA